MNRPSRLRSVANRSLDSSRSNTKRRMPPSLIRSKKREGSVQAEAVKTPRSNEAQSSMAWFASPEIQDTFPKSQLAMACRAFDARVSIVSTLTTLPVGPTIRPIIAAFQPLPPPSSNTRCPGFNSSK